MPGQKCSEWKDVPGWEGKYKISNKGIVARLFINSNIQIDYRCMKPIVGTNGYVYSPFGNLLIHRVVADLYIDNPNGYTQVHHIDGSRDNNCISNLEWCTIAYNNRMKYMGIKRGVSKYKDKGWKANIKIKSKGVHLGVFKDKEEAYMAFYKAYEDYYGEKPW